MKLYLKLAIMTATAVGSMITTPSISCSKDGDGYRCNSSWQELDGEINYYPSNGTIWKEQADCTNYCQKRDIGPWCDVDHKCHACGGNTKCITSMDAQPCTTKDDPKNPNARWTCPKLVVPGIGTEISGKGVAPTAK